MEISMSLSLMLSSSLPSLNPSHPILQLIKAEQLSEVFLSVEVLYRNSRASIHSLLSRS